MRSQLRRPDLRSARRAGRSAALFKTSTSCQIARTVDSQNDRLWNGGGVTRAEPSFSLGLLPRGFED